MNQQRENRKLLRGSFPKTSQEAKGGARPSADLRSPRMPEQAFAVTSNNERAMRFKLHTREGQVYSVPYSLLPVFVLSEGKELRVIAHDIEATISGRNLDVIEDYLSGGQLLWLKESPSGKDDGVSQVFIQRMDIQLNED
ncbi:MAG: hypothetical protein ABJF04_16245 [Reichenbachiella sp.]|uniref:hypothetical protein n=2 Tax=Reichenbachiella sp. TaxID=2184521 RepID=UPI0032677ADD